MLRDYPYIDADTYYRGCLYEHLSSYTLVREVQSLILQTFDLSDQSAQDYAAELVALAEGWGSPENAAKLVWSYRIRKDLGEKLRWRSDHDRARFEAAENQKYADWDAFNRGRRSV